MQVESHIDYYHVLQPASPRECPSTSSGKRIAMRTTPDMRSENGATLVELAITFPFFIAMIFGLLFTSMAFNARTSLSISMGEALRYGITRGDRHSFGGMRVIADIDNFVENKRYTNRLPKYLYSRGLDDNEEPSPTSLSGSELGHIQSEVTSIFGKGLQHMPPTYVYSYVYIHELMRTRLGHGNVKYPCDDRPGCLKCRFLNPDAPLDTSIDPEDRYSGSVPMNRIYMECSYLADFGFYTAAMSIFSGGDFDAPGLEFVRSAYINRGDVT